MARRFDGRRDLRIGMSLQQRQGVLRGRGEKSATRRAVCFHAPVSEKSLIRGADRHSRMPRVIDMGGTNCQAAPNVRCARAIMVSQLFSWILTVEAASSSREMAL